MPTNNLEAVIPQILAQGLLQLRSATIMPRIVNTDYSREAAQKGDTVDVPIPSALAANDVTPGVTHGDTVDLVPTKVPIQLNKWKEAHFALTDKEIGEAMAGIVPMQVSSAIAALAEQVNSDILATYKGVFGYAGTAGTTPFGTSDDISDATAVRKVLNNQKAPLQMRRLVLDPDAEANALGQRAFQDTSWRSDAAGIIEGQIGRKLGFDVFMDQQVPTHTAGTGAGYLVDQADVKVGDTEVTVDTGTGTIVEGDVFTVAGDTQTYVVTSPLAGNKIGFYPGAKVAWADDAAITLMDSHVVNLAFHRDAIALAVRQLDAPGDGLGSIIRTAADPVSRLTLRLEVSRESKQTRWSFDILYGVALVRPELAARLAG